MQKDPAAGSEQTAETEPENETVSDPAPTVVEAPSEPDFQDGAYLPSEGRGTIS